MAALQDRWGPLREPATAVEMAWPGLPLTGDLLLACPEGVNRPDAPVFVGIALEREAPVPDGFLTHPVKAGSPGAVLRFARSTDDLLAGAAHYRQVYPASTPGILLELPFGDRRDGTRYRIWNLTIGPGMD